MRRLPLCLLALAIAGQIFSQSASKPTLTPKDYDSWQYLVGARMSDDGRWMAYGTTTVGGDSQMVLKNNDSKDRAEVPGGTRPRFSPDSKWCAYMVLPSPDVAKKLAEDHKPVEPVLGIRNLYSGQEQRIPRVVSFQMLKSGPTLMIQRMRNPESKVGGSDMTVLNLTTGQTLTIGNVVAAAANHDENLLLISIQSGVGEKGVQLLDTSNWTLKTLSWGMDDVQGLDWADKADVASYLLGKTDDSKEGAGYRVVIASDLRSATPTLVTYDPAAHSDFPAGERIAPYDGARISSDGGSVAVGLQVWQDKPKTTTPPQDRSNVMIWNTKDVRVVPAQIVSSEMDRERSDLWVWRPKGDLFKQVTKGDAEQGLAIGNYDHAIVIDQKPYQSPVTNGFRYTDLVLVNPWTGDRKIVAQKSHWAPEASLSPDGKYVAYYEAKNWWILDVATGKSTNATWPVKGDFSDTDDDHIMPEKPFATPPVWLRDSEGVIFGDLYDEYLVKPGTEQVTQLTHGRKDNQQYRYLSVAEDQEPQKLGDKLYFHVFDRDSKAAGFYSCDATGQGKVLAMDNVTFGSLFKAKDADRVLFVMGSYEKSPDVYVTNTAFSAVKPESHTNPQQANFAWGHTELVNYKSRWGAPLQGVLIYPANYQAGKTYPMVTYIYEKESDELNHYVGPDPLDPYNVQILSQTGYFVFKPDITYRQKRTPGQDAQDCLEPAVQAVLAKNVGVDPKHIGLMGHSWGAYQTAFVTTVSKMFAVGIAGAPLTELTSMYNSYYWNSGATDQESFESGQGRMGVPFWEDPKPYIDNSPVWRARERTSPILFAAGTNDGAVDFDQSLYLYNTLRRLGKEAVLLVYPGENHSLASKPVREDYGRRVRQYLGVYLKGETPEKWISEGVPFIKRDEAP